MYINSFQSIWPEHVMVCTTRLSDPSPSTTSATKAPNGSLLARFSPGRARSWLTRMENASFVPSASTRNVVSSLEPGYRKLSLVREFLTTRHDLYSAKGLVARAARRAGGEDAAWAASYGGRHTASRPAAVSPGATTPVSPGAATPSKPVCPPCEAATPAACGYSFLTVLVAFAVGAFLGGRKDRGHYRTY